MPGEMVRHMAAKIPPGKVQDIDVGEAGGHTKSLPIQAHGGPNGACVRREGPGHNYRHRPYLRCSCVREDQEVQQHARAY